MPNHAHLPATGNAFPDSETSPDCCQGWTRCAACGQPQPVKQLYTPPDFVDQSGSEFTFKSNPQPQAPESTLHYRRVFSGGAEFCVGEDGCVW